MVAKRTVAAKPLKRRLDAFPDRIDLRDWPYQPTLSPLPDELTEIPSIPLLLDQGNEGACTGFALAAVINHLLKKRGTTRTVSPRMLYEMARCYDEWPGEKYEGSSARGAMKGWARHGVCEHALWADKLKGRSHLNPAISQDALAVPCGSYYRVNHKEVRDVHAALPEVGIVYCTLMVHQGWDRPGPVTLTIKGAKGSHRVPVIQRKGKADAGHAVAFVGYTRDGFLVQNSWGEVWGAGGCALLPYEDFLLHATDVWVAQVGVPVSVDLWARADAADTTSGRFRGRREIPLSQIRPYTVDVGNNGELSQTGNYWTSEEDLKRLFLEAIPEAAAKNGWKKKRVLFYIHGGLNSEDDAAKRVVALRDKCLANGVYPLHVMWETGAIETLGHIIGDLFTQADERAGGGLLEGLREAKDRVLELTASPIGGAMWSEMKENARRACDHHAGLGAMQLMKKYALESLAAVDEVERKSWELHVVAHSAGSILFAHAAQLLCSLGISFKTLQMFAPAIRIDEFKDLVLPLIKNGSCPQPTLYVLNKQLELDDTVGPYGKSLLWLVSNAFEDKRSTPLLGMTEFLNSERSLVRSLEIVESSGESTKRAEASSRTHGGFDNDPLSINSALTRILGHLPQPAFEKRDLDY